MATWSKNAPSGNNSRRKWKLEDRASLNNLKYHIAEEGCSDVQYDLAKQLLESAIEQNESNSNQQAVHWLICASQQGHENAVKLLQQCYIDNCGITAENESEVLSCLSMTPGERAARKAARELFACLSNGGEHITPKQLERKMREIYHMQKRRRRHGDTATSSSSEDEEDRAQHSQAEILNGLGDAGTVSNGSLPQQSSTPMQRRRYEPTATATQQRQCRITEENLVTAAVYYAAGRLPTVNDALTLSVPHPSSLNHVPRFHRLLFHPIIFLTLLYHRLINLISALPNSVSANVRLALLFLGYLLAAHDNLTNYLPLCFYYSCWSVMVWSTCKMLKTKHDFVDFRIWSGLFLNYGDHNIEANVSEHRFLKNNMKPFLYFFGAFVGNLLVHPLIDADWLPHSELTIVSFVCMFVTLFVFMYSSTHYSFPDWMVLFSFGINVLAKYPYEMDEVVSNSWRFLDLKVPTFCSFVVGNGIEFCLNCRTALYLFIPGFLVHLAKRSNWHGIYTFLIPHCVTLSWLQLCILSSQSATMFGVVRAALGLAGVLLFLPLFGIISLLIPVFVVIDWLGFTNPDVRLGINLVASILTLLGSCFMAINRNTQKYITTIQIGIFIIASCVLTLPYMTSNFKDNARYGKHTPVSVGSIAPPLTHQHHFSWQRYYELCGPPAWQHENRIKAQLRCAYFNGLPISWEGTVSHTQISRVYNVRAKYISQYLPTWLANLLRCLFGERITQQLKCDVEDEHCANLLELLDSPGIWNGCSLQKWNTYEYEIYVRMAGGGLLSKDFEIVLQANDKFSNFTNSLATGDRVQFYGLLRNSRLLPNNEQLDFVLGSAQPLVQLNAIECLFCMDKTIEAVSASVIKSPVDARLRDLMRGTKYLLNVLFNPLITFK